MENRDSRLVQLLHDITQLDYQVHFCPDFEGGFRIEFTKEYDDNFYSHRHLFGNTMNQLEKS